MFHVEHEAELRDLAFRSIYDLGLNITEKQIDLFMVYLSELIRWNRTVNLTSIIDPREIIIKHFVDSLVALTVIDFPHRATLTDIGSGAGFPAFPLKIVRPDLRVTLIEPNRKRDAFLRSIAGQLGLEGVTIFPGTAQKYVKDPSHVTSDLVVLRAIRFDEVATEARELVRGDGKILLYRSGRLEDSREISKLRVESEHSFQLPEGLGKRVITVLKVAPA